MCFKSTLYHLIPLSSPPYITYVSEMSLQGKFPLLKLKLVKEGQIGSNRQLEEGKERVKKKWEIYHSREGTPPLKSGKKVFFYLIYGV